MLSRVGALILAATALPAAPALAQVPVEPAIDQAALLKSDSAVLAANKRLVYDFWRTVLEAGRLDRAPEFLAPDYIQHNPNVPTGLAGFVSFFTPYARPTDIAATVRAPLVAIVAEGDLVTLAFAAYTGAPDAQGRRATKTMFDMFRVRDGKIVEHWDGDDKR